MTLRNLNGISRVPEVNERANRPSYSQLLSIFRYSAFQSQGKSSKNVNLSTFSLHSWLLPQKNEFLGFLTLSRYVWSPPKKNLLVKGWKYCQIFKSRLIQECHRELRKSHKTRRLNKSKSVSNIVNGDSPYILIASFLIKRVITTLFIERNTLNLVC